MSPQEARNWLRSKTELDPEVQRTADRLVCQLTGAPDLSLGPDGSVILRWNLYGVTTTATVSKDQG